MMGVMAGLAYEGLELDFRFNYNASGDGYGINHKWGRYPGFNKSIVEDFSTADSKIYGVWAMYDCGKIGLGGVSFHTSWVQAMRSESGQSAGPDTSEFDVTINYKPPHEILAGLFLQVRGAWVSFNDQPGAYTPAINDYRFTVNYEIPLL